MSENFDIDWDIEKYRSKFESEEHWLLRRKFLVSHKDKYPEDKLVCLAQVFFNVELLGCKYPDETMALVSELSEGIADEYRENKQQKLQRTFVKASDAAGAKIKGLPASEIPTSSNTSVQNSSLSSVNNCNLNVDNHRVDKNREGVVSRAAADLVNTKEVNNLLKDVVIWKTLNEDFFDQGSCIVQRLLAKINLTPEYEITENKDKSEWLCVLRVRGLYLANASGVSKQISKKAANEVFLDSLQEICYTVEEKTKVVSDGSTINKNNSDAKRTSEEAKLPDSNVGSKMMKLMGWKGGGLGKTEQGRAEPVIAQDQIRRSGLGSNLSKPEVMKCLRDKIMKYARQESNYDLVFSSDFSKDERAELHKLAQKYHLSSRSYGTGNDRHLVVSKRIRNHTSIVTMLLGCGGENERYKLIPPFNVLYQ